jgi:hypothetical protein
VILATALGHFDAVVGGECLCCPLGVLAVLGVVDIRERGLRAGMRGLRQRRKHFTDLVHVMPTSA